MKRILSWILALCMVIGMVPVNVARAAAFGDYPELFLGTLELDMEAGETVFYKFTPKETGIYRIDSQESYYDVVGYWPQIYVEIYSEEDDTSYDSASSSVFRQLEAGETYLLSVRNDSYIQDYDNQTAAKATVVFKMLDYPEIELGKKTTVTITGDTSEHYDLHENGDHAYFLFKPEKTETYTFRSFSDVETIGQIHNNRYWFEDGYGYFNGEGNCGFVAERTLNAGEIYILATRFYKPEIAGTNSYDVMIEISHDYAEEVISEGTCSTAGTSKYTCSHCGDSYTASTSVKHTYMNGYCSACGIKEIYSGSCGDHLTWEVDCTTGVLTISGTGEMYNYRSGYGNSPGWFNECSDWGKDAKWSSVVIKKGVTRIGDDAFGGRHAGGITSIELPNTVVEIGNNAFGWNNSLASVSLSGNLKIIGDNAFEQCEALTKIHIPNNVETIGDFAFSGCFALKEIYLGNSVETIGQFAFSSATNLSSIVIPASVTTIGDVAFSYSGLTKIRFEGNAPAFPIIEDNYSSQVFSGLTATVYYPAGNATWTKKVMQDYYGDITWTPYSVYKVLDDSDTAVVAGKNEAAALHIDAPLSDFVGVEVDGETVADANYTLTEGSTIITFSAEYLDSLFVGEHKVSVEFTDGYAYSELVISEKGPCDDGHIEEVIPGKEATCTEPGLTEGKKCSVCGEILVEQEEIPVKGHAEETVPGKESTCTEPGLTEGKKCSVCGEILVSQEEIPLKGHAEETVPGKESTCTEPGLTEGKKCSVCGKILDPQEEIPAKSHEFKDGYCQNCGEPDPDYEPPIDPSTPDEPEPEEPKLEGVIRIAGADRIGTSLMLADQLKEVLGVEKFDAVVVASALNFPDALTGSYLAAVKDAPILLTYEAAHPQIRSYIQQNLKPGGMVYILGGESAVSNSFATGLNGFNVKRVAGSDRFGTNLEIMREAGVSTSQPVLIATALNFADSLSASAAGLPMVLVYGSLRPDQKEFLMTTSRNFIIIGGTSAVSEALEAELAAIGSVQRLAGAGRYQTSVMVAQKFVQNPDDVVLAYARNFPDGLCGGPLAYALGAPLILTDNYDPSEADKYVDGITAGIVVGGTGLISDASARAIFDLAGDVQISTK